MTFDDSLVITGGTLRLGGKNLTTNSTTTVGPGTLDISGGGNWTANGPFTLGPGGIFVPGSSMVKVNNSNWTNNGGSVVDSTTPWTLDISGPGSLINGTAATQNFYNLTVSPAGGDGSSLEVGGSTTTMNLGGTLTIGPKTIFRAGMLRDLTIGRNLVDNGGSFQGSTQLNTRLNGTGQQVIGGTAPLQFIPGNVWVEGPAGDHTVAFGDGMKHLNVKGALEVTGGAFNLGDGVLTTAGSTYVEKAGTVNLGPGTWNAQAPIYLAPGGTFNGDSGTLNVSGSYIGFYGGTVNPGTSTTNFLLTGNQRISGKGVASFHNVNIYNNAMSPSTLTIGSSSSGPSAVVVTRNAYIGDQVTVNAGTASKITIAGDLYNNGLLVPGASTFTFNGSAPLRSLDAAQTIGGAQPTTFNNLTVDNPAGVTLGASQMVSGVLSLRGGGLTTAGYTLTLGSAATVSGTHAVVGAVQRTQAFVVGVPYSFGHPNLTITFATVGSVTSLTVNTQNVAPAGLRPAIPRTVTIAALGAGHTATLRLPYQDAELNGIAEADLRLWRRGAADWKMQQPQVGNATENWVEQSGITAFSAWALAPINASPGSHIHLPLLLRR